MPDDSHLRADNKVYKIESCNYFSTFPDLRKFDKKW